MIELNFIIFQISAHARPIETTTLEKMRNGRRGFIGTADATPSWPRMSSDAWHLPDVRCQAPNMFGPCQTQGTVDGTPGPTIYACSRQHYALAYDDALDAHMAQDRHKSDGNPDRPSAQTQTGPSTQPPAPKASKSSQYAASRGGLTCEKDPHA